jgi:hypothetical protein
MNNAVVLSGGCESSLAGKLGSEFYEGSWRASVAYVADSSLIAYYLFTHQRTRPDDSQPPMGGLLLIPHLQGRLAGFPLQSLAQRGSLQQDSCESSGEEGLCTNER